MSRVTGIVLAAGVSRRLGRPKQLLTLGDATVIEHVVRRATGSSLDDVIVVTGAQDEAIRKVLSAYPVRFAHNPRYSEGQGTSLAAGIAAVDDESRAVVVLLGDQPGIEPATIDRVIDAFRQHQAPVVMADYGEERSHPVLFARELFSELAALDGDAGGRDIVRRYNDMLLLVDGGADASPVDIDTEDAYQRLSATWPFLTEQAPRDR